MIGNTRLFCFSRLQLLSKSEKFVEPEEKSSGYVWKRVRDETTGKISSKPTQSIFQYVAISKTLTSLFSDSVFEQVYADYNATNKHQCTEGVYKHFCCGSTYKNQDIFQNPLTVQIRLFTDDFEPCDALKSKVGMHKITAYYFQINNMPSKYLSKLNSIYLVALCDANDRKNESTDPDIVVETIMHDIQQLERSGFVTHSLGKLNAALAFVLFDNLGGNLLYGFSGGFNANFYCRVCSMPHHECMVSTSEQKKYLRNITDYNKTIEKIGSGGTVDLTETKGIKQYCVLNELKYFHILDNMSVDIMHDIFEGIAAFLLKDIFEYCSANGIIPSKKLQSMIESYNYGTLSKKNVPSKLCIEKKNLGQNASQLQCLFAHVGIIFFKYRSELQESWFCIETLNKIIRIIMSYRIEERDIIELSKAIHDHLSFYQTYFKKSLKPKHHLLSHYETIIRRMGPVIHQWTKRMEGKHQYFKTIVRSTNNFKNLNKTLALRHQEYFAFEAYNLRDSIIVPDTSIPFECCPGFEKFDLEFANDCKHKAILTGANIKYLNVNQFKYKPKLLICTKNKFLEIEYILSAENSYFFLCSSSFVYKRYDKFSNSIELIKLEEDFNIVEFNELTIIRPFEIKFIEEKFFVLTDGLDIYKIMVESNERNEL